MEENLAELLENIFVAQVISIAEARKMAQEAKGHHKSLDYKAVITDIKKTKGTILQALLTAGR